MLMSGAAILTDEVVGFFFRSPKISTSGSISDDVNSDNSCPLNSLKTDAAGLHLTEPLALTGNSPSFTFANRHT